MKILTFGITRILGRCNRLILLLLGVVEGRGGLESMGTSGEHGKACQPTFLWHHSNEYYPHICQTTQQRTLGENIWTWCVQRTKLQTMRCIRSWVVQSWYNVQQSWSSIETCYGMPFLFRLLVLGHSIAFHHCCVGLQYVGTFRWIPNDSANLSGSYLLPEPVLILALNTCFSERRPVFLF